MLIKEFFKGTKHITLQDKGHKKYTTNKLKYLKFLVNVMWMEA